MKRDADDHWAKSSQDHLLSAASRFQHEYLQDSRFDEFRSNFVQSKESRISVLNPPSINRPSTYRPTDRLPQGERPSQGESRLPKWEHPLPDEYCIPWWKPDCYSS